MPIYQFHCQECGHNYDDFRTINETEEKGECIVCGSVKIERGERHEDECGCGCGDDDGCGCGCC